jgi:SPRY domain
MIGFAPSKLLDLNGGNNRSCGWYLYLHDGTLYSQDGDERKPYCSGCKVGDSITCIYNSSSGDISFEKNGVSLGVAFTNVEGEDIAPAVELFYTGDSITLSAISYQYSLITASILSRCMHYIFIFGILIRYHLKLKTYSLLYFYLLVNRCVYVHCIM